MFGSRSRLQRLALGPDFRGQVGLQRGLTDGGSAPLLGEYLQRHTSSRMVHIDVCKRSSQDVGT